MPVGVSRPQRSEKTKTKAKAKAKANIRHSLPFCVVHVPSPGCPFHS